MRSSAVMLDREDFELGHNLSVFRPRCQVCPHVSEALVFPFRQIPRIHFDLEEEEASETNVLGESVSRKANWCCWCAGFILHE